MKKLDDPRHRLRINVMQALFTLSFNEELPTSIPIEDDHAQNEHALRVAHEIASQRKEIDAMIEKAAPAFPVDKIARVDLSILRLAIYELCIDKKNPQKVVIDEAVELGKEFGGDTSSSFINGVLGNVLESTKNLSPKE